MSNSGYASTTKLGPWPLRTAIRSSSGSMLTRDLRGMSSAKRQKLIALAIKAINQPAQIVITDRKNYMIKQERVWVPLEQEFRRTSTVSQRRNASTSIASDLPSVPLTLTPLSLATCPSITLIGSGRTRSSSPTPPRAQPMANTRPRDLSVVKTVDRCMPSRTTHGGPLLARRPWKKAVSGGRPTSQEVNAP